MFKNKRIIAIAMTLLMVVSMLPGMAFAEGGQNLVDYNEATRSKILTKEGKPPVDKDTGVQVDIWRIGAYGDSSNFKQYLFHGADVEKENSGIPTVDHPYANKYGFKYTILTDTNEEKFWDNYIQDELDSTKKISFGMFFSGTGSGHFNNNTVDDFVLNENILQIVELDKNGNIVNTPLTGKDFYLGYNGASYNFIEQTTKIEPNVSGVGSERSNDVLINIEADTLKPGTDYQLVFKSGMGETDVAVLNKKVVFNFTTANSTEYEEGIILNRRILTLETNETAQLTATLGETTLTEKDVTWKSPNENVAKVSKSGKVTAVAKGETVITVTTKTDNKTATCKVTVVEPAQQIPAESIVIKNTNIAMEVGKSINFPEVEITPADSTDKVTWESSDAKILKVKTNKMEGVAPGTVTLTAKISDTITATCTVTVKGTLESNPDSDYKIINGANSTWKPSSDGTLAIRGDGDFSKFQEVKVDGQEVARTNYEVSEGSTIITFKKEFLNTLSAGNHTVEIVWTDGSASTNFTVDKATDKSTQTGDNMNMTLYVVLMLVALAAAAGAVVYRRQRQ